jgi:CRP/FNR family cyclic AMP-dependent transcriptional regulator
MNMSRSKATHPLAQLPLFSHCTKSELEQVRTLTTEVDVLPGTTLCREGALGREAFVVLAGEALVERNGTEVPIVGDGAILGEMALLGARVRSATVRTTTSMRLLVLETAQFRSLLEVSPFIAQDVLATAALRRTDLVHQPGWLRSVTQAPIP